MQRIAVAFAHEIAARLATTGAAVADDGTVLVECLGVRVTVRIEVIGVAIVSPPAVALDVRAVIIEAAFTDKPISLKALAKRAGYGYTSWFRGHVNALVESGKLVRTSQGVRRAA